MVGVDTHHGPSHNDNVFDTESLLVGNRPLPQGEAQERNQEMNITSETPRHEVTIQSQVFTIPAPYSEGHTLTSGEASALNQLLTENVRNNFAGKIKAQADKPENERQVFTQEDLDAYVAEYEFGVRRVGGGSSEAKYSPEEREARKIAREKVTAALKARNIKINSVSAEKMEELVSAASQREEIVKEARRRVKAAGQISLEELGLDAPVADAA